MNNNLEECIIIFIDLIGSSEVATELNIELYSSKYLGSFYNSFQLAKQFMDNTSQDEENNFKVDYTYTGDEILVIHSIKDTAIENAIENALSFSFTMKLYWLFSEYSIDRIMGNKAPREIAIGIHTGKLIKHKDKKINYVGYDINIAKRVETESRKGLSSNIFATGAIANRFNHSKRSTKLISFTKFNNLQNISMKGVSSNIRLWESDAGKELFTNLKKVDNQTKQKIASFFNKIQNNTFLKDNEKLIEYIESLNNLAYHTSSKWFLMQVIYIHTGLIAIDTIEEKTKKIIKEYLEETKKLLDIMIDT